MKKLLLITFLSFAFLSVKGQKNDNNHSKIKITPDFNDTDTTYKRGYKDGFSMYKGYKGIASGTLVTSLLSPILGLAPAIGGSSGEPRIDTYMLPKNNEYIKGYLNGSKDKRNNKVWGNWALGSAISIGITAIIFISLNNKTKENSRDYTVFY